MIYNLPNLLVGDSVVFVPHELGLVVVLVEHVGANLGQDRF